MAIGFATINIHVRSKGHSAVAAAAYRSGTRLKDQRYGLEYDFKNKENIIYTSVMLPAGSDDRFRDRETLWNEVEKAETKSNARVSKDIIIALPKELNKQQWVDLSRRFADEQFVSKGVAADLSIHQNEGNPHCHILITTRRLLGNKFDTHKARDLDGELRTSSYGNFSANNNLYHNKWRDLQNEYFEEKNIDICVDQNYLISQLHEGRISTEEVAYLKEQNASRMEQAKEIALHDPEMVLTMLTNRNTVFSIKDIESIAYKHSETEEQYETIKNNILSHKKLISLGYGLDGKEHFTTAYAAKKEYQLYEDIVSLNYRKGHSVKNEITEKVITDNSLTEEQAEAVRHLVNSRDVSVVMGKPGTGKSYMLKAAKEAWEESGYNVTGATVAGIASRGLKKESGIDSRVIASLNYSLEQGYRKLSYKDILVIDEAGMVDVYDMQKLSSYTKAAGAKMVLIGDINQLQPIGPGAPLRMISEKTGFVEMANIRRQEGKWQRHASYKLARGDISGIDLYKERGMLKCSVTVNEAYKNIFEDWSSSTRPGNLLSSVMIAHRNIEVETLNDAARKLLVKRGILKEEFFRSYTNFKGEIQVGLGEKLLFTKNSKELNVKNGSFGIVTNLEENLITVEMKDGENKYEVAFDAGKYKHFTYGYASTVHKLQGATIDKSFVYFGGKAWNRNLVLVALTRHKKECQIYYDNETYSTYDSFKKSVSRESFKDSVLNYPVSFALRRGIDPDSIIGRAVDKLAHKGEQIYDKWLWLVNRQAYLERQQKKEAEKVYNQDLSKGKIVNKYIELRRELAMERSDMAKATGEELYKNKNYPEYFKKQILLNKIGAHIYNNFESFEKVCQYNNLSVQDFKNNYLKNSFRLVAEEYVNAYVSLDSKRQKELACGMKNETKKYLPYIHSALSNARMPEYVKGDVVLSIYRNVAEYNYENLKRQIAPEKADSLEKGKAFAEKLQRYRGFWQRVYALGRIKDLSKDDISLLSRIKKELSKNAYEFENTADREDIKTYLKAFSIKELTLEKWSEEYSSKLQKQKTVFRDNKLFLSDDDRKLLVEYLENKTRSINALNNSFICSEKEVVSKYKKEHSDLKMKLKEIIKKLESNKELLNTLEKSKIIQIDMKKTGNEKILSSLNQETSLPQKDASQLFSRIKRDIKDKSKSYDLDKSNDIGYGY